LAHAKAKLTPAGRLLIVSRVLDERWPPAHAAAMAGVSRQTLYKWLRRFRAEGLAGLQDRSSRPHRCPRQTTPEIEARVLELRQSSRKGPHQIAGRLGLAPSTVHAVLARRGLSRLSRLDRTSGVIIRYERAHPGELVHVDVKKLGRVPEGGGWRVHGRERGRPVKMRGAGFDYLHVAIDDHSRFAYIEVHPDERGDTCGGFLTRAIGHFDALGVQVQSVMTDNALNYVRATRFREALGSDRRHLVTRPYRPQTNGKAERFNRTLLEEWAYLKAYSSNAERTEALEVFLEDYNWVRTHSSIGNRPPASRLPVNNVPGNYI
jgi:transposase InsO family protein